jgi:hypothetical protein
LEAQQHKKYAQTTPLDDGVSSLFIADINDVLDIFENVRVLAYADDCRRFWTFYRVGVVRRNIT